MSDTHTINLRGLHDAIDEMAGAFWTDSWHPMPGFTCREADALAGLLGALGLDDLARACIAAHAAGDEEGDEHFYERFVCSECGKVGTVDDGIEGVGGECPDEDCDGTMKGHP